MALQLNISTIGGKEMTVVTKEDWVLKDVKRAVHETWSTPPNKQKLFNSDGVELLDDAPLTDFCHGDAGNVQLSLVILQKSAAEMKLEERWKQVTPAWLQEAAEGKILEEECFTRMSGDRRTSHPPKGVQGRPRPVVEDVPARKELTAADIIASMRRRPFKLSLQADNAVHFLDEHCKAQQACLTVVQQAVVQEPELMLPQVEDRRIALGILQRKSGPAGIFHLLPAPLQQDREILHAALEIDDNLRHLFMNTAGRQEINEWQWSQDSRELQGKPGKKGKAKRR